MIENRVFDPFIADIYTGFLLFAIIYLSIVRPQAMKPLKQDLVRIETFRVINVIGRLCFH